MMEAEKLMIIQQLLQTDDPDVMVAIQQLLGSKESSSALTPEQWAEIYAIEQERLAGTGTRKSRDQVKSSILTHKTGVSA